MGRSIIRYYFSDDEFIMKWMSNSLVVTPFLKIIRKPVLMLINHAPSVSSTATGPVRKKEIKCVLMIIPFFRAWHLLLAFLRFTYIHIQNTTFIRDESPSLQLVCSHYLFPAFWSGHFLLVTSVEIDLVGFIFPIQTSGSSQGTLPSFFSLVMYEYARG